jgi:hypothetical protein
MMHHVIASPATVRSTTDHENNTYISFFIMLARLTWLPRTLSYSLMRTRTQSLGSMPAANKMWKHILVILIDLTTEYCNQNLEMV